MAIKSIVVHPKGATHKDNLDYWNKQVDGKWFFVSELTGRWLMDVVEESHVKRTPITEL